MMKPLGTDRNRRPLNAALNGILDGLAATGTQPYYLVNGLPKSGSSYLYNLMEKLTGAEKIFLSNPDFRTAEQDLYLPSLIDAANIRSLSRQHFRANDQNVAYLRKLSISPVILVRNIFDIVVSFRDTLVEGIPKLCQPYYSYSVLGYFDHEYLKLDRQAQYDFIIKTCASWCLNFVASWANAERNGVPVLWVKYEDLVAEPVSTLSRIARLYDLNASEEDVARCINDARGENRANNFNRGIAGRGASELTASQKREIADCAGLYRRVDFSCLGL
jgi:hypothetical protein